MLNCLLFTDLERRSTYTMSAFVGWYTGSYPDTFLDSDIPIFVEFKRLAVSTQQDLSRAEQLGLWQTILKMRNLEK